MEHSKSYHAWQDIFAKGLDSQGNLPKKIKDRLDPELLPLLNVVFPTGLEDTDRIRAMSGQMRSESTLILLTILLRQIIPQKSLVVLENAHWLDSASWGLALAAIKQLSGILLLIALRPLSFPVPIQYSQIMHHRHSTVTRLKGLAEKETSQLIASTLLVDKVPPEMSKEIHSKGQGNPFLTIELVHALRDNKAITITKTGECLLTEEIAQCLSSVPSSLTGLITSKVDRLEPSQQIVLKVASVIGQSFTISMLSQVLPEESDAEKLEQDLKLLVNTNLVVVESSDPQVFAFSNTLIRDAIYGLMLFAQRRALHKQVALLYQKEYPGNSSYYSIIGHHLKHAEEDEEAIGYFLKSGSNSLFNYANKEAISFFTEAINLTVKLKQQDTVEAIGIERKLGQTYYNLGQVNKADEHFRKALEIMDVTIPTVSSKPKKLKRVKTNANFKDANRSASEMSHRRREAVICLLALVKLNLFSCNRAIATYCANYALGIADDVGEALLLEIYATITLTAGINGDHTQAEAFIKKAGELNLGRKQLDVQMAADQFIGMYYSGNSRWKESEERFKSAIEAARTVGNLRNVEESMIFLGTCYYHRGKLQKAVSTTAEALESAVTRGDPSTQILGLNAQARNLYALGEYNKAMKCLADVRVALESGSEDIPFAGISYCGLTSLLQFRRGKMKECVEMMERGYKYISNLEPSFYFTYFGYACLAEVSVLQYQDVKQDNKVGLNKPKALSRAEKTLSHFSKFGKLFNFAQPRVALWKGALNFLCSKSSKADAEWTKCEEICTRLGLTYEYAFVLFQRGFLTGRSIDTLNATKAFPVAVALVKDITGNTIKFL